MPALATQGISLHYELFGDPSKQPVMLIAGLGGTSASWGSQIDRFASRYYVIAPDHRGTGRTTHTKDGLTIAQHAADMASLLEHLAVGPTHLIGASTGGAIAQLMALDHAGVVQSVSMTSSFAHADPYLRREFGLRRKLMASADLQTVFECYALFLFSPSFASLHPNVVTAWIEQTAARPADREIALARIDMIMAHDALDRLGAIRQPALVICGDADFCTPLHLSKEIAQAIPGSELVVVPGSGHLVDSEQPERYFEAISGFIDRHTAPLREPLHA